MQKSFLIDMSRCTACRGCQMACKQWHKFPGTRTVQRGSFQNPEDLSTTTYKLVRFSEAQVNGKLAWLFFPEQCRHCIVPPCKDVADAYVEGAILRDPDTQAVLYTDLTRRLTPEQKADVHSACPYNIPRWDDETGIMAKCDMCYDRVINGLKPACVQTCPTGTMNFGNRDEMLELAQQRLEAAKKKYPAARLVDPDYTNVIFLAVDDPKLYYEYLEADASGVLPMDRRHFFAMLRPGVRRQG
ncbi:Formate dehydrogenase beta subunit [Oleidesulfovibrio alaskensis G20]|jgi:formate dehydrogenase iron-sulfur subunit|uniref:Formate dehydrogenase beta subunit n=1 Tax=Oleidesulfovibrio alaskensis (strain ATCC BAA-1058 / DSM 17464 / G20) TaxID=207559 RepID=Q314N3_OLEA2|nr:4Fe-4S dicluster domain-containing protein [Oleidesulfovibrio alaskensis]ABB37613.1 Formate dehydrogenase beta subunit [Oleidesulfovibrio alaskensis G20]MBG0773534.1 formate dehydrogenase [Oleidesulfovibrio alaskensis]MBL3581322.1 formate dehydrogenase [Oleidesulfovibrio alaskensis]